MKLQESFLDLKKVTMELESAVHDIKSRATDSPPDQKDYLVTHFTEKALDLLGNIKEAVSCAEKGSDAAEKPDVVKANKYLEEYEKRLGQISEMFSSQIDRCKLFTDLEDKKESEPQWKDYATDLIDAICRSQICLRHLWDTYKLVNRELREQNITSLANPILIRANELLPEMFKQGSNVSSAEQFYNMLSTLSCDNAVAPWGGAADAKFSAFSGEQDATALINNTMSTIFGSTLSPSTSTEEKSRFSDQVKNTLSRFLARKEEHGNVRYELQPGYFGPATPIAGKEITGRQATLYQLAKTIHASTKELLKGLIPINNETDIQDVIFLKESIDSSYVGIVEELGRVAGPVTERVDSLLFTVKTELGLLKERLGLHHIAHIDFHELKDVDVASLEQSISNFALLEKYLKTLRDTWEGDDLAKSKLENASGTIIAKLTNVVQSVPGSVSQIVWAMDSSGMGQADRDSTPLEFDGTQTTIGGALKWIGVFSEQDCYPKLRDRDARLSELRSFEVTFNKQVMLVDKIIDKLHPFKAQVKFSHPHNPNDYIPPVLGTPRVMRALYELHQSLLYAHTLVEKVLSLDKRIPATGSVSKAM